MDDWRSFDIANPTEEHAMIREMVRDFAREEVEPQALEYDRDEKFNLPLLRAMGEIGLLGLTASEEYGGAGLSLFANVVINEEMVQHAAGLYCPAYGTMGTPPPEIIWAGSDYLSQKYGVPTVESTKKGWFAITEPSGGSDPGLSPAFEA